MERMDPDRPDGFPRMRCSKERRALDANERALLLGGTPANIRMTVQREIKEALQ